ncbi:MAG: hypothetical protein KGJ58_02615 [Patescibacteria group bacterium]|nr:hypothetical protein [Patescibacteria group bacterium]MDE2218320.1 hypothetical protein [Patescibacteria group bacterium]
MFELRNGKIYGLVEQKHLERQRVFATRGLKFCVSQFTIVSNYSRRLHSHKTLVLELAADGYNLTQ